MDSMETDVLVPSENNPKSRFGIPVVAVIGLPLLAVLIVLFLGFGLTLQSQRAELTKAYAERTGEFLALDMARQLSSIYVPAEHYTDTLAGQINDAGCLTAECVFSIIQAQQRASAQIPEQVNIIRFGATNGHVYAVHKITPTDNDYLGIKKTAKNNRFELVASAPGVADISKPYDLFDRGWYRGGMVDKQAIWSAPYKRTDNFLGSVAKDYWSMTRVVRIDDPSGKPLGVLTVDVCINQIGRFLQGITGKTAEKLSILPPSGEEISIVNGSLSIVENIGHSRAPLFGAVTMNVSGLKDWRVAVTLSPQLSQQLAWNWHYSLILLTGLLISIILAALAAGFVVNPIMRLSRAVTDVGNLKLDKPIAIPTGIREIGFLASVIEKMRRVLHQNQARLEFLAYHNPDDGLLNQRGLTRAFEAMNANAHHIDLVLIKVCNYNQIASIFGDAVLTRLIAHKIAILQTELKGRVVGCLNNNQIAYLLPDEEGVEPALIQKVLTAMRLPFEHDGIRISLKIAGSVASKLGQIEPFDNLLRRANGAMHYAEETQSEDAVWYNPAIIQDLRAAIEFGGDITKAIARGEFSVTYQPVVDLRTGRICEAQAGVVWHHPEFGEIRSHKFTPILEGNGSIRHLGLFVMSHAFEFLHGFKRRTPGQTLRVGVNLSFTQLMDPLFIERVTELQAEWSIDAGEIKFIITQNAALLEDTQIVKTMRKLRKLGFHLIIDHFAMAHATVNGSTAIQYDGMMVGTDAYRGIEQPGVERMILQAACELARKLGMERTAVGIDNHAVIDPLIKCGCTYGRGPWFGKSGDDQEFLRRYDENATMFTDEGESGVVYQI